MLSVGGIVSETFGFVRRNVGVIAVWCVVYMATTVAMGLLMRPMADAQLTAMTGNPPQMPSGMAGYMAMLYLLLGTLFIALFNAAFRAVLKPEQSMAAYLRLGMDELRLLGLTLLSGFGWMVLMVAMVIVMMILGIVFALVMGGSGAVLVMLISYLGIFGVAAYLITRLSAAAPLTLLRGRITVVEAWKLTSGHFWTLFGAYLSIVLIVAIPFICLTAIVMGGFYHHIFEAPYDPTGFQRAMQAQLEMQAPGKPMWFAMVIGSGLLGGFGVAMQGAMTAIATRILLDARDVAATFE